MDSITGFANRDTSPAVRYGRSHVRLAPQLLARAVAVKYVDSHCVDATRLPTGVKRLPGENNLNRGHNVYLVCATWVDRLLELGKTITWVKRFTRLRHFHK